MGLGFVVFILNWTPSLKSLHYVCSTNVMHYTNTKRNALVFFAILGEGLTLQRWRGCLHPVSLRVPGYAVVQRNALEQNL